MDRGVNGALRGVVALVVLVVALVALRLPRARRRLGLEARPLLTEEVAVLLALAPSFARVALEITMRERDTPLAITGYPPLLGPSRGARETRLGAPSQMFPGMSLTPWFSAPR